MKKFGIIGLLCLCYLVGLAAFLFGVISVKEETPLAKTIAPHYAKIKAFLTKGSDQGFHYHNQEKANKFDYTGFRQADPDFTDPGYLLLSRFSKEHNQVIVELVRLRDFKVLHRWLPPIKEILKRGYPNLYTTDTLDSYRVQHPLLLDNGELVFHSGEGSLIKIDQDSNIVWAIEAHFHHSIERLPDGNIIVPIAIWPNELDLKTDYRDDGYAIVTPDGQVRQHISAGRILMDNGYKTLLMGVGIFDQARLHLNDVQPIMQDRGSARAGDLALSFRNISTVALYRPSTGKIVWLKTGPWLFQHDVNMLPDGRFSVFDNHVYMYAPNQLRPAGPHSGVYVFDPDTDTFTQPYAVPLKRLNVFTETSGRAKILANGDVFVEESDSHRLLRTSPDGARWSFVNGISATTTGQLHWSRYISETEFSALKWDRK